MKKLVIAAALAAAITPSPASATNWVEVARSMDGINVVWVDADRIVRGKDSTGIWMRLSLKNGAYAISLVALRCPSRTYMDLKKTYFDRNGTATTLDVTEEWEFATPDTVMDGVFDKLC